MKLTLGQMFTAQNALSELINMPLKTSTSFKISRNVKLIKEELDTVNEKRQELAETYDVLEPENRTDETMQKFNSDFEELLATEVEVPLTLIDADQLVDQSGNEASISPATLMAIDWMFE